MNSHRALVGVISLCTALFVEVVPMEEEAEAQSAVDDARSTCAGAVSTDAVYRYLTGNAGKYNTAILTTKTKTLTLGGAPFTQSMPYTGGDYTSGDLVSIPYTSSKGAKVGVDMSNLSAGRTYEVTVCVYDLKSSAKSWSDFATSDLVATYGRRLKGGTGPMTVSMPASSGTGVRGSQVITIGVVHFNTTVVPTFRATITS